MPLWKVNSIAKAVLLCGLERSVFNRPSAEQDRNIGIINQNNGKTFKLGSSNHHIVMEKLIERFMNTC